MARHDLLSVKTVMAAKPRASKSGEYLLSDGDGLYLRVRDNGDRSWLFVYTHERKRRKLSIGPLASVGLADARTQANRARQALQSGMDPVTRRDAELIQAHQSVQAVVTSEAERRAHDHTFHEMFALWKADGVNRRDGNAELQRSFDKDVLPRFGQTPVRQISEHDLRKLLRSVVARGSNRQAVALSCDLVQMFNWAEKRQPWRKLLAEGNPASLVDVSTLVDPDYDMDNQRSRVLTPSELRELRNVFVRMETDYEAASDKRKATRPVLKETQLALWICLATACRIGELLMSRWENLDLEEATWFIPKRNVKKTRGRSQDHLVFLSPFAQSLFKKLSKVTGKTDWCFPARSEENHIDVKAVTKQVGDRQHRFKERKVLIGRRNDNTLVLGNGANGDWTPHDMRRTAATMMQALKVPLETIDRCQNHLLPGSKVRRHYMHHDYADEMRQAWALLGGRLEEILALDAPTPAT